jgi:hypothetical protein
MTDPIKWSNAPDRTSWGHGMMVADIALDRDHTLTLFCEADQTAKVDAMFAEVERLREALKEPVSRDCAAVDAAIRARSV